MTKLRIAVIGAGLIGRRHIALVHENPNCCLAAVVDAHPDAVQTAAEYGAPFFQDTVAMLDTVQVADDSLSLADCACSRVCAPSCHSRPLLGAEADAPVEYGVVPEARLFLGALALKRDTHLNQ